LTVLFNHFCLVRFAHFVADPEGAKEPCPQTHDRLKKSCESCCRRDSVFWRCQWLNFFVYSPPGKTVFSALFCMNSSAFDRATVILECQSGQVYWRSGPGRITLQKQTFRRAGEHTKIQTLRPKNEKKISGEGALAPPQTPPLIGRGH